ncbi:GlsB/YeaQ/YmgE family stress response membrane protein [Corallococcus sicarius]|uniref:GlsB/YeaQ/YmgE family stress response membrane protein n=1 Tax=Corallococcus sicarius TaxID=2316726 RepID=UPI0026A787D3
MGLFGWIIFGFFAGLIARAVLPGNQRLGCLATTLLGVGGAFVGGFLTSVWPGHRLARPGARRLPGGRPGRRRPAAGVPIRLRRT